MNKVNQKGSFKGGFPVYNMDFVTILALLSLAIGMAFLFVFGLFILLFLFVVLVVVIFLKTRKIIVPRMTLMALNLLEDPLAYMMGFFGIKPSRIGGLIVDVRNSIFDQISSCVPAKERMLFLPYCLRSRECPARLEDDGLMCVMCGRCDIGRIKKEAENMEYRVFIVPGSSLIKRILERNRPKAVIGVGCHSEVRAGAMKMAEMGMPVKGFILDRDGCIDTVVDVSRLFEILKK